jgi:hypothetical protein
MCMGTADWALHGRRERSKIDAMALNRDHRALLEISEQARGFPEALK